MSYEQIATRSWVEEKNYQSKITATGLLKGNGSGGVSAAVAGTDYQAPIGYSPAMANPNLLDNWYFGNPVNQRGITSITNDTSTRTYTIDRWKNSWSTISVSDGLTITKGSNQTYFIQMLDPALISEISGRQLTVSCLVEEVTGSWVLFSDSLRSATPRLGNTLATGLNSYTFTSDSPISTSYLSLSIASTTSTASIKIKAIKLELGSVQTLARQENSSWVLTEIPDYGEQLRRCQRYFRRYKNTSTTAGNQAFAMQWTGYDNRLFSSLILDTPMRTVPTLTASGTIGIYMGGSGLLETITLSTGLALKDATAQCVYLQLTTANQTASIIGGKAITSTFGSLAYFDLIADI